MNRPLRAAWVVTISLGCSRGNERPTTPTEPPQFPPSTARANPPPLASCPASEPASGSPCAPVDQRCTYESCGVATGATATCTASQGWQIDRITCNPPPPG